MCLRRWGPSPWRNLRRRWAGRLIPCTFTYACSRGRVWCKEPDLVPEQAAKRLSTAPPHLAIERAGGEERKEPRDHDREARVRVLRREPPDLKEREATRLAGVPLRLGSRDFTRAIESGDVVVSGPYRELWALRKAGRLTPAQVTNVNESIQNLANTVSARRGKGRLYAITILLTPLDRQRKTVTKSKGDKKR